MFTVQKKRALLVSKGMNESGGGNSRSFTDAEVTKLLGPLVATITPEANNRENLPSVMLKLKDIVSHARMILEQASKTVVAVQGEKNKTILSILQGAFGPGISGWTMTGDDMKEVKKFANIMLNEIQFPKEKIYKTTIAANETKYQEAA